jgi:hypothetical protein
MKSYYYVYNYGNLAPRVRHPTLESAVAEAQRLGTRHPGATFEVLKAVALSKVQAPATTFYMDGVRPNNTKHGRDAVTTNDKE